jgi:hypothetical protein
MTFLQEGTERGALVLKRSDAVNLYAIGFEDGATDASLKIIDIIRQAESKLPNERAMTREQILLIIDSLMNWLKEKRPEKLKSSK